MSGNKFFSYGDDHPDCNPDQLVSQAGKKTLSLITGPFSRDFELNKIGFLKNGDQTVADIIVVDCVNDQVPHRNPVGIKTRERLALVFSVDGSKLPEARALRINFPVTLHQNGVAIGEPVSLCLYIEPWSAVERSWTPQKYLQRVLWWLAETVKGTLHLADQPVEQLYYNTNIEIVLPPNFDEMCHKNDFVLTPIGVGPCESGSNAMVITFRFVSRSSAKNNGWPRYVPLVLSLSPITHGNLERFPSTLGELEGQLSARGASVFQRLCDEARRLIPHKGISRDQDGRCLLILQVPIQRVSGGDIEKIELRAFAILKDFTALGEALGVLDGRTGKYCAVHILGHSPDNHEGAWCDLPILPVDVKRQLTYEHARKAAGIIDATVEFCGVLAGVGALGGVLADLWSREAWGSWTLVDPDHIKAHNISRHIAKNYQIGQYKVEAVKALLEANYFYGYSTVDAVPDSVTNSHNTTVQEALSSADLLIDVTTTLEVPRELSKNDQVPRSASVFLTPSGHGSVLLVEDFQRMVRLESLEAQYYRAIINSNWGETHLKGHYGFLWVGGGCRDVSAVISFELIQLHGATLAKQLRFARNQEKPSIRVWESDSDSGAIAAHSPQVFETISSKSKYWRILWDIGTRDKLCLLRAQHLPNETGGVILGYIDHTTKTIYVVDVLFSPSDSAVSTSSFTRGFADLNVYLDQAASRTANVVGYIGEWHSHPARSSAWPSSTDHKLVKELAKILSDDGQPALMIIVGEHDVTLTVQEM